MDEAEFKLRQAKARRQTMWTKQGKLIAPQSEIKRSICNVHLILAKEIENSSLSESDKMKFLLLVDEVYQLGKRMATKLDYYGAEKIQT